MIDFHSHILPRIDDGSRSSDESLELLRIEKLDGVDEIVFTPHFYAEKDSPKHFLDRRQGSYERLLQRVEDSSLAGAGLKFHLGAEICYFTGMGRADVLKDLSIDGTGTALIEMPFAQWNDQVVRDIEELIQKQGLNVILAHIERYEPYQKNRNFWDRVFDVYSVLKVQPFRKSSAVLPFFRCTQSGQQCMLSGIECIVSIRFNQNHLES